MPDSDPDLISANLPSGDIAAASDSQPDESSSSDAETLDLRPPAPPIPDSQPTPPGLSAPPPAGTSGGGIPILTVGNTQPRLELTPYIPDKQRDYVRLIVTVGLLLMLGWVIVWSCIDAASWPDHWAQTKEMLQTILPALTGLIGSVIGFYFGSGVNSLNTNNTGGASGK